MHLTKGALEFKTLSGRRAGMHLTKGALEFKTSSGRRADLPGSFSQRALRQRRVSSLATLPPPYTITPSPGPTAAATARNAARATLPMLLPPT